jgi:hypothetical protein
VLFTDEQLIKLRGYYKSLVGQRELLAELVRQKQLTVFEPQFRVLANEINEARWNFPALLPMLIEPQLSDGRSDWFSTQGVLAYVTAAVARIEAALEGAVRSSPVTERLDLSFVHDPALRDILERDWDEGQRAYIAQCWKCVVILTGGAIEAALLDRILKEQARAVIARSAPKKEPSKWELSELIRVGVEIGIIEPLAETLLDAVRQYRNLVHPGVELRSGLNAGKLEADSGFTVMRSICRDLSRNN